MEIYYVHVADVNKKHFSSIYSIFILYLHCCFDTTLLYRRPISQNFTNHQPIHQITHIDMIFILNNE